MFPPNYMSKKGDVKDLTQNTLNVTAFYGHTTNKLNELRKNKNSTAIKGLPYRLSNLFGPTQVWKVFNRQNDALEFSKHKRNGVMPFAFQQSDGNRMFLVAHPKVFWHYDVQKTMSKRCTYEIIPEWCTCKLYFDLEFDKGLNPSIFGPSVVDTFISVVLYFLLALLNIRASRENILDLDSSTEAKFSRHLIFQPSSIIFCDNKSIGDFVNLISHKVQLYLDMPVESNSNQTSKSCECCNVLQLKNTGCIKDIGLPTKNIKDLLVLDRKGKRVMLCDRSVYTRNRHFRIYQNTKWSKNSPLLLSKENVYRPVLESGIKPADDILHEAFFLDSLISNISFREENMRPSKVIEFKNPLNSKIRPDSFSVPHKLKTPPITKTSPYPEVDRFINELVLPGHIWRMAYFTSSSVVVYDIVGNRYCQNIGRPHRSNNIKYIVCLENYTYYQKCHDPECHTFRSSPLPLPPEIKFKLEDDFFTCEDLNKSLESSDHSILSDSDLMEVANIVEEISVTHSLSEDELL